MSALVPCIGFEDIRFNFRREERFSGHIDCELAAESLPILELSLDW
jgi:hypothetical protein